MHLLGVGTWDKTFDSISACLFSGDVVTEVNHSNIMWWLINCMPMFTCGLNYLALYLLYMQLNHKYFCKCPAEFGKSLLPKKRNYRKSRRYTS